jgi:glutamyl-tRNA reductase
MNLRLIGVNHKTAPVEVRERLAIPESRLGEAMARLARHPGVEEAVILSTCNRVELIACSRNGSCELRDFLRQYFQADPAPLEPYLYEYRGRDALRHLFRVASSLESMVVGEPQILGQVKEAYAIARSVGAVHTELEAVLARSLAVAKRVRSETAIGSSAASVASVAVELAKKIFGSLEGKQVYLVGAGKMSELAARHLIAHGAGTIFVANRSYDHARLLAQKFNGQAMRFEELYQTADRADIVITSTGAPHAVFRREHGEQFLHRRKNRPMFFIDIAVPRDVDPEMSTLDGIFVYDIDDLQSVVNCNVGSRAAEAERAETIIESELDRFTASRETAEVTPTIISLQEQLESIRRGELERARRKLGELSPEQEAAVEAVTRGIINKVMHLPIRALKSAARERQAASLVELVQRLFNLEPGALSREVEDEDDVDVGDQSAKDESPANQAPQNKVSAGK